MDDVVAMISDKRGLPTGLKSMKCLEEASQGVSVCWLTD